MRRNWLLIILWLTLIWPFKSLAQTYRIDQKERKYLDAKGSAQASLNKMVLFERSRQGLLKNLLNSRAQHIQTAQVTVAVPPILIPVPVPISSPSPQPPALAPDTQASSSPSEATDSQPADKGPFPSPGLSSGGGG